MKCNMIKNLLKNGTIESRLSFDKVLEIAMIDGCGIASGELLFDGISFKDKAI